MTITEDERARRIAAAIERERSEPERYAWLSFSDPDKPNGQRFLGATIVKARGPATASQRAWDLGINPGGVMMSLMFDEAQIGVSGMPRAQIDFMFETLRTRAEIEAAGIA